MNVLNVKKEHQKRRTNLVKVGVCSDSHQKIQSLQKTVDFFKESGVSFIIHAGDICKKEGLDILKQSGLEYVVVYGNNDASLVQYHQAYNLVKEPYYFLLQQTKIKLMHLPFYMTPDAQVVISGHTHKFHCEYVKNTLFLNPGEVCAREKPVSECAILTIDEKKFDVDYFTNYTLAKHFSFLREFE